MSINMYARQAPLHDVVGRVDYISNEHRQENLLAVASTVSTPDYWQQLAADCQAAFRQAGGSKKNERNGKTKKACEGREIHVELPNSALDKMTADQMAKKLANDFKSKYGMDCMVAVHYNKALNNLHFHILFSERHRLLEPVIKLADRNAFIDENGVRKRTKKEILDADGQLREGCSIVKKGEILSARYFEDKVAIFSEKEWMDDYRHDMADWINTNLEPDELRTVFDPNGPYLAQKHLGKGTPAEVRRQLEIWNAWAKEFNRFVEGGVITQEEAKEFKTRISLSPNQTEELKAVMAEVYREMEPQSEDRPGWDDAAAKSAAAPLAPTVESRDEKQQLRDLYKAQGKARIAALEQPTKVEALVKEAEARQIGLKITRLQEQLGLKLPVEFQQKKRQADAELRRSRRKVLSGEMTQADYRRLKKATRAALRAERRACVEQARRNRPRSRSR